MVGRILLILCFVGSYGQVCNTTSPSNSTAIGLAYCQEAQIYVMNMLVGTPAQSISLLVDISQPMIAVTLPQCAGNCPQQIFDPVLSETFNESGSLQGQAIEQQPSVFSYVGSALGSEKVSIPPVFSTSVTSTILWILEAITGPTTTLMPYGGIFGLGMPNQVGSKPQSNFLSNQLTNYTFSLQLASTNPVLYIQKIPDAITQNGFRVAANPASTQWSVQLAQFFIATDNYDLPANSYVTFSTTQPCIYFTNSIFQTLFTQYFSKCKYSTFSPMLCPLTINIQQLPIIQFIFQGGYNIKIRPSLYAVTNSSGISIMLSNTSTTKYQAILGQLFMKQYVTTFSSTTSSSGVNCAVTMTGQFYLNRLIGSTVAAYLTMGEACLVGIASAMMIVGIVFTVLEARNNRKYRTNVKLVERMLEI